MKKILTIRMAMLLALLVSAWQISLFYNDAWSMPFIMMSNFWMPAITMVLLRHFHPWRFVVSWLGVFAIGMLMAAWSAWNAPAWELDYFLIATQCVLLILLVPWALCYVQIGRLRPRYGDYIASLLGTVALGFVAVLGAGIAFLLCKLIIALLPYHLVSQQYAPLFLLINVWVFEISYNLIVVLFKERDIKIMVEGIYKISGVLQCIFAPIMVMIALFSLYAVIKGSTNALMEYWDSLLVLILVNIATLSLSHHQNTYYSKRFFYLCVGNAMALLLLLSFALWGFADNMVRFDWTVFRLFGFALIVCLVGLILAYALAMLFCRQRWAQKLMTINSTALMVLMAVILLMNGPVIDVFKIQSQSVLARFIANHDTSSHVLESDLVQLGRQGEAMWQYIENLPAYQATLQQDGDRSDEERIANSKKSMVLAQNSPAIEDSWWRQHEVDYQHCTQRGESCIVMARDMNQDGKLDVVLCSTNNSTWVVSCTTWQKRDEDWLEVDSQNFEDDVHSEEEKQVLWQKLSQGDFGLKPKKWQDISVQLPSKVKE